LGLLEASAWAGTSYMLHTQRWKSYWLTTIMPPQSSLSMRISKVAANPALTAMAADAMATENVILWGCQVFCKSARTGRAVPWHQDGQYWPIEPLRACTVWVALDDSTAENGALRVIPGTHREGELTHQLREDPEAALNVAISPESLGPERLARAHVVELSAGEVSIHEAMLVHGSEPNRSGRRRAGMACHYMPAECLFRRDVRKFADQEGGLKLDYATRPLLVVRGRNQHPRNEFIISP